MVALDIPNIQAKASDFMNAIDDLETSASLNNSVDEIERLKEKLKIYRKTGLDDEGEFSTENLVFKILRNTGYLEKLSNLKDNVLTKNLTLENISMYDGGSWKANVNEADFLDNIKSLVRKGTLGLGVIVGLLAAGLTGQDLIQNYEVPADMIQKAEDFMQTNLLDTLGINDVKAAKIEK
jgi:hypothetical protein